MIGQKIAPLKLVAGKKEVPTEIYSRVVGYYRPITTQANPGKQAEFYDRKEYDVNNAFRG